MGEQCGGAIYMRLSREDNKEHESESIANQRRLLHQYAIAHHISILAEYSDDGITGTTQNRKGLQKLFSAIEEGSVHTVLVKDLSRLSRNYLHTGMLIEEWFPQHGVRLISVDDGIDTGIISPSNDIFAIRAVLDDWYARDISRKVRAAISAKQSAGYCTSASLPYGYYRKNSEILIDERKAEIVRMIFDLYESGHSCCSISRTLQNQSNEPMPIDSMRWNDSTVRRILTNPAYTGTLQIHKSVKFSYKSSRRIHLPESEFISYPIPPIISHIQYTAVQELISRNGHCRYPRNWLSGIVYCALCGAPMHISGNMNNGRIICSTRKRFQTCSAPSISCSEVSEAIRNAFDEDEIPDSEAMYRRMIRTIRISPEMVTICLNYRKPEQDKR